MAHIYDLFISYAQEDQDWVKGYLLDALKDSGVRFHTEAAFALGAPRILAFENAIKNSARILLVLSPAYLAEESSQFVDLLAQSYGLQTDTWPVIPLLLKPAKLPTRLGMLTQLDATKPEDWENGIKSLLAVSKQSLPESSPIPECPYPGMVPFKEDESERFFGRDTEIEAMRRSLRGHRFLTVIGSSGSGKSSLVHAGLLPVLKQNGLTGKKGAWIFQSMRPGEMPLSRFNALLEEAHQPTSKEAQATQINTLIVIDQFEETFTSSGVEALPFQNVILEELSQDHPNLYLVLTVRADFYKDLMASPLWREIQKYRLEVTPLEAEGLKEAIVKPAEQSGVFIESALVERLLADAEGEPGVLPFLQETLVLLWEKIERRYLPMRAYDSLVMARNAYGEAPLSALQVAIAQQATNTLNELSGECQAIARRIFLRLIQFGEGRADTRRQQRVEQLRSADDDPEKFENTRKKLDKNRLITMSGQETPGEGGDQRRVDLSHEALITGWPTLRGWIDAQREAELTRRRLETKAAEWVRLGKSAGGLLDEIQYREANQWLETPNATELGKTEDLAEFIKASDEAIKRSRRQKKAAQMVLATVALVAAILAVVSFTTYRNLQAEQGNAKSAVATANAARTQADVQQRIANAAGTQAALQQMTANAAATEAALANEGKLAAIQNAQAERDHAQTAQAVAVTAQADTLDKSQRLIKYSLGDFITRGDYPGELGAVQPLSPEWTTVVADGDGQAFAISRAYGSGRVLAVGHERVISSVDYAKDFLEFAFFWLNGASEKRHVLISFGHCEWVPELKKLSDETFIPDGDLENQLKEWKYEVSYILPPNPPPIDESQLKNVSVLVIGNAWGAFEQSEIDSIKHFVEDGGGLFTGGLGWSWQDSEHNGCGLPETIQPGEDVTLSRYPMNLLVAPYGMQWIPTKIFTDRNVNFQ